MESFDFRQTLKFIEVTASSNFNDDWVSKKLEEMGPAFAICLILPSLHFLLIFTNTVYLFFVDCYLRKTKAKYCVKKQFHRLLDFEIQKTTQLSSLKTKF